MVVVVGLGKIGTMAARSALLAAGFKFSERIEFKHGREWKAYHPSRPRIVTLVSSYHPSRQNTNTGVLTEEMLDSIFSRAGELLRS
jgi:uracil-DNA glycosylase